MGWPSTVELCRSLSSFLRGDGMGDLGMEVGNRELNNELNPELKPKRKRIPHDKLVQLQQMFETTDTPSYEVREQLAIRLDMTNREVQVWFQNRRAKLNRMRNESLIFRPPDPYSRLRRAAPAPIRVPTGYVQCGPYTAPSNHTASSFLNHNLSFRTPAMPHTAALPEFNQRRPSFANLPSIKELGLDSHLPSPAANPKPRSSPSFPLPPISYLPAPNLDQIRRKSSPDLFFR